MSVLVFQLLELTHSWLPIASTTSDHTKEVTTQEEVAAEWKY